MNRIDAKTGRGPALPSWALAAAVLLSAPRSAYAYIDPGTGGQVLGSLAPILGAIAIVFAATFRWTWVYIRAGLGAVWRARLWSLPLLGAAAAAVVYLLLRG